MPTIVIQFVVGSLKRLVIIFSIAFSLSGCGGDCRKFDEIKSLLEEKIKIGDTREKVDRVFSEAKIDYGYDEFANRYQSTVYDQSCGKWVALSIYVSFDAGGKVAGTDIRRTYTSL